MSVKFIEMEEEEFQKYKSDSIENFAKDMINNGLWVKDNALDDAKEEIEKLLPQGIKTEGHKLMNIFDQEVNNKLGHIWFQIMPKNDVYIWDFVIFEKYRGKGYGKEALTELENYCRNNNISKISLNVFGNNEVAINLYKKVGYKVMAMTMGKDL